MPNANPNPRRSGYPAEFRAEAVRLARSPGHSMESVARDLGVSRESIRRWGKQLDIDAGRRDGLTSEERDELRTLEAGQLRPGAGTSSWPQVVRRSPESAGL